MDDEREPIGRVSFRAHVGALAEQEHPPWQDKPPAWEELSDGDREFYMRIGAAVAARAVAGAVLPVTSEAVHALIAADGDWAAVTGPASWLPLSEARARNLLEAAARLAMEVPGD
jgi:hypothetical protein